MGFQQLKSKEVLARYLLLIVVAAIFLFPNVCFAEVMDKEFSLPTNWAVTGALTVVGYLLGRYRIWAGILAFILAALLAWAQISELIDPYVGPDITREAGRSYVVQSYLACAIALFAPIIGIFLTARSEREAR